MPHDKTGKKITWKEFFSRWKKGIVNMTPLQQAEITYRNTYIMLFGIILGIIFSLFSLRNLFWLTIILIAALVNTIIIQIGTYQKLKLLRGLYED